jgi:hypothetical protein
MPAKDHEHKGFNRVDAESSTEVRFLPWFELAKRDTPKLPRGNSDRCGLRCQGLLWSGPVLLGLA